MKYFIHIIILCTLSSYAWTSDSDPEITSPNKPLVINKEDAQRIIINNEDYNPETKVTIDSQKLKAMSYGIVTESLENDEEYVNSIRGLALRISSLKKYTKKTKNKNRKRENYKEKLVEYLEKKDDMKVTMKMFIYQIIYSSEHSMYTSIDEIFEVMTQEDSKNLIKFIGFTDTVYSNMCTRSAMLSQKKKPNSETISPQSAEAPLLDIQAASPPKKNTRKLKNDQKVPNQKNKKNRSVFTDTLKKDKNVVKPKKKKNNKKNKKKPVPVPLLEAPKEKQNLESQTPKNDQGMSKRPNKHKVSKSSKNLKNSGKLITDIFEHNRGTITKSVNTIGSFNKNKREWRKTATPFMRKSTEKNTPSIAKSPMSYEKKKARRYSTNLVKKESPSAHYIGAIYPPKDNVSKPQVKRKKTNLSAKKNSKRDSSIESTVIKKQEVPEDLQVEIIEECNIPIPLTPAITEIENLSSIRQDNTITSPVVNDRKRNKLEPKKPITILSNPQRAAIRDISSDDLIRENILLTNIIKELQENFDIAEYSWVKSFESAYRDLNDLYFITQTPSVMEIIQSKQHDANNSQCICLDCLSIRFPGRFLKEEE